eukprot:403369111
MKNQVKLKTSNQSINSNKIYLRQDSSNQAQGPSNSTRSTIEITPQGEYESHRYANYSRFEESIKEIQQIKDNKIKLQSQLINERTYSQKQQVDQQAKLDNSKDMLNFNESFQNQSINELKKKLQTVEGIKDYIKLQISKKEQIQAFQNQNKISINKKLLEPVRSSSRQSSLTNSKKLEPVRVVSGSQIEQNQNIRSNHSKQNSVTKIRTTWNSSQLSQDKRQEPPKVSTTTALYNLKKQPKVALKKQSIIVQKPPLFQRNIYSVPITPTLNKSEVQKSQMPTQIKPDSFIQTQHQTNLYQTKHTSNGLKDSILKNLSQNLKQNQDYQNIISSRKSDVTITPEKEKTSDLDRYLSENLNDKDFNCARSNMSSCRKSVRFDEKSILESSLRKEKPEHNFKSSSNPINLIQSSNYQNYIPNTQKQQQTINIIQKVIIPKAIIKIQKTNNSYNVLQNQEYYRPGSTRNNYSLNLNQSTVIRKSDGHFYLRSSSLTGKT